MSHQNQHEFEQRISEVSESYIESEVPPWDRAQTMTYRKEPLAFWQRPIGFISLAFSFLAITVVTVQFYKAELEASIDQRVETLVAKEMSVFKEEQETAFAMHGRELREDFRKQLSASTTQLATYILATNRKERQQNYSQLVEYMNEAREEDYDFYATQLRQLQSSVWPPLTEKKQ
ncbi:hypothetical protein [Idiomarina sp. HP20-50]|uniref:hypothetical protein n=1 Tax=Idiomarina sp. HP20-50 TaxID=3070813 RepID=UPI00294B1E23|nr:hypothetical protein [Idiomarina sp. HP20-50]MDV6315606.1 hypothetical protein [Idiomarina sp. HP20-50]